jgi:hypothetical protein
VTEHHVKALQRQRQPRARLQRLLMRPVDLRLMGLAPSQSALTRIVR